jgi:cell division protein FtsB
MSAMDALLVRLAETRGVAGKLADQLRELHGELHALTAPRSDDATDSDDSDPALVVAIKAENARLTKRNAELRGEVDELKREAALDKKTVDGLCAENLALERQLERCDPSVLACAFHEHMRQASRLATENDRPWVSAPSAWRHELEQVAKKALP